MPNEDCVITEDNSHHDFTKFIVKGRVNTINAEMLLEKLEDALKEGKKNLVLNMSQVPYLSSTGIRVILKIYKDAVEAGGKFHIELPSDNVKNVLGITALKDLLVS